MNAAVEPAEARVVQVVLRSPSGTVVDVTAVEGSSAGMWCLSTARTLPSCKPGSQRMYSDMDAAVAAARRLIRAIDVYYAATEVAAGEAVAVINETLYHS